MVSHHGVLQRLLVACRPVLGPLGPVGVNVSEEQLLDLPSVPVVLRLHPYQSQLHHGEAQRRQTPPPSSSVVQLVRLPRHHLAQGQSHAGRGQTGGQPLLGGQAVNDNGHLVEVVLCIGRPPGDPGGMSKAKLPPDHQGVGRVLAATVGVVVLQGLEMTARMEGVGAGKELWTWPDFTSGQE